MEKKRKVGAERAQGVIASYGNEEQLTPMVERCLGPVKKNSAALSFDERRLSTIPQSHNTSNCPFCFLI
jgi:hypothetical protein